MFAHRQLIHCLERKDALLQRSTIHRLVLAKEAQNLRPVAGWVDLGIAVARKTRDGWSALAPLLSLWQTRKHEPSCIARKLAGAIAIARSLTAVWKRWH